MKIIIVTQKDYFFIPRNIEKIIKAYGSNSIKLIIQINNKGSINSKKKLFIKGFGIFQTIKYGFKILEKKISSLIYNFGLSSKNNAHSIYAVSNNFKIPFKKIKNINCNDILEKLESLKPDIIVSFSAPVVFKQRLLNIPKLGCINLHCSFLPFYAGLFPSFWVLYNNEKYTGCTIHRMDTKIDNGEILKQKKVEISPNETIFSLLSKTKSLGGSLMLEVIEELLNEKSVAIKNISDDKFYYSWPTLNELLLFRKKGGKLI